MINNFFQKLHTRLTLILLFVFLAISSLATYVILQSSRSHQQHVTQQLHTDLAKHVVDNYLLFKDGEPDLEQAKHTFHDLMILGPNFEFYLLDQFGEIRAFSAKPHKVKRRFVSLEPIKQCLNDKDKNSPIYGDNPRDPSGKKVFSVAPIIQNGETLGYLYTILGSDLYDSQASALINSKILTWGLVILGLGLLFSFICAFFLLGLVIKPLRRLALQTQNFNFEDKSKTLQPQAALLNEWSSKSHNEIHMLGTSFRTLLKKLEEQYDNVITLDELRKELLAHISHDLRTPLASLLGYLETWQLNHEQLTPEASKKYITVAQRNAKTISKLVEQLFELAHLDSGNVQINMERFSIADLVQDVLQKFAIHAEKRGITLAVTPQDSSIQVVGDIEKLERVFTNLLENALRHTKSGGTVTVKLSPQGQFVGIEVSDNGIGIPEEDLPHIFDAHYKAGNSVRGNTRHGGIGLAITKRIIELHTAKIDVTSRMNEGTTFSFELQSAGTIH